MGLNRMVLHESPKPLGLKDILIMNDINIIYNRSHQSSVTGMEKKGRNHQHLLTLETKGNKVDNQDKIQKRCIILNIRARKDKTRP